MGFEVLIHCSSPVDPPRPRRSPCQIVPFNLPGNSGRPCHLPPKVTAFGVVQAVNTREHHLATVKGATRTERNMLRSVKGEWQALDADTLGTLTKVLARV